MRLETVKPWASSNCDLILDFVTCQRLQWHYTRMFNLQMSVLIKKAPDSRVRSMRGKPGMGHTHTHTHTTCSFCSSLQKVRSDSELTLTEPWYCSYCNWKSRRAPANRCFSRPFADLFVSSKREPRKLPKYGLSRFCTGAAHLTFQGSFVLNFQSDGSGDPSFSQAKPC